MRLPATHKAPDPIKGQVAGPRGDWPCCPGMGTVCCEGDSGICSGQTEPMDGVEGRFFGVVLVLGSQGCVMVREWAWGQLTALRRDLSGETGPKAGQLPAPLLCHQQSTLRGVGSERGFKDPSGSRRGVEERAPRHGVRPEPARGSWKPQPHFI